MVIFDGIKFAAEKEKILKAKVADLRQKGNVPKLVSILVGNNSQSQLYLALKAKKAREVGIDFELISFKNDEDSDLISEQISQLNSDPKVYGIMVQLPFPERYQDTKEEILGSIDPKKDIDCLTPTNLGFLLMGDPRVIPATPKAVMQIIEEAVTSVILGSEATPENVILVSEAHPESDPGQALRQAQGLARMTEKKWLTGEDVCVVGASNLVGKPLAMMLSNLGATVTICRSTTSFESLRETSKKAGILVSAVGKAGLITKEMVKPGAIVIDVGVTRYEDIKILGYKVKGDVNEEVREVAGFFTPVPGGVGPVTIICLLENLIEAINPT